ncbi:uncharacterized protein MONBRDRAFT_11255 [Monosiga brevicollis MX1]|uniref:Uncharacterized protein n=1 Tax=Monosiga brevicollis TaxID=81824 RepID=A9V8N7_MONBE|nr:uncharacterized protein MONBRDRAFT_11255 [Monosiga brevicollis MX1]EDQ86117.1 predicted protein [Monosiga brevicollis MX1]|eukprot:XP_001749042.1 hypothetical protein [Monosiga brevicollis MX1]
MPFSVMHTPVDQRVTRSRGAVQSAARAAATRNFEARTDLTRDFQHEEDHAEPHALDCLVNEHEEEERPKMAATGSHPATPSTGAAPVEATASASRHAASAAATSAAAAGPGSPRNNDAAVAQVHRTLQALVHSLGSQHQLQSQIAELEREINAALRLIPDRGRSHGSLRAHETQSPSRDLATDFSLLAPSPAAHPTARDGEVAFGLASNRPLPRLPREPVHESLSHDSRYRHGYLSSPAHDDRATTPRRSPMEAVDASQFGVAFGTNAPPRAGSRTQPPHHVWHRAYQTSTKWESYRGDSKKGLDCLKENVNSALVLLQAEPLLHMATLDLEGCTAAGIQDIYGDIFSDLDYLIYVNDIMVDWILPCLRAPRTRVQESSPPDSVAMSAGQASEQVSGHGGSEGAAKTRAAKSGVADFV